MKYKSAIIASGSGSISGATFSRNRFGSYIRNRAIPVNTNTTEQQQVRNLFTVLSSRWVSVLTQAQRDGWDTYGANVAVIDGLGNTIHLTGLNWYVACNSLILNPLAPSTVVDDAPTIFSADTFTTPTAIASEATQTISTSFNNADGWATEVGGALLVYASRPFSPSRNFFAGPYQLMDRVAGAVVPPPSPNGGAAPFTFVAGQKIGMRYRTYRADGRISNPQTFTIIAAA